MKITFHKSCTHNTSNYIKFLIGVNFHGDLHLDVSISCKTESENWNFLKYGRIGKRNPYIQGTLYLVIHLYITIVVGTKNCLQTKGML